MNFYIIYLISGKVVDIDVYDNEEIRDKIFDEVVSSTFLQFDTKQKFNQI